MSQRDQGHKKTTDSNSLGPWGFTETEPSTKEHKQAGPRYPGVLDVSTLCLITTFPWLQSNEMSKVERMLLLTSLAYVIYTFNFLSPLTSRVVRPQPKQVGDG